MSAGVGRDVECLKSCCIPGIVDYPYWYRNGTIINSQSHVTSISKYSGLRNLQYICGDKFHQGGGRKLFHQLAHDYLQKAFWSTKSLVPLRTEYERRSFIIRKLVVTEAVKLESLFESLVPWRRKRNLARGYLKPLLFWYRLKDEWQDTWDEW